MYSLASNRRGVEISGGGGGWKYFQSIIAGVVELPGGGGWKTPSWKIGTFLSLLFTRR